MNKEDVVRALIRDQTKLLAYLYAIVRESPLAEDLFQELVVLAMQKHREINDVSHLLLWARRAARLEALKALRDRRRSQETFAPDVLDLLENAWHDVDATDLAPETDRLRECMDTLTPRAREILKLKYFDGVDGARIALSLRTKVHSVYVSLTRIHKALADCLAKGKPEADHA